MEGGEQGNPTLGDMVDENEGEGEGEELLTFWVSQPCRCSPRILPVSSAATRILSSCAYPNASSSTRRGVSARPRQYSKARVFAYPRTDLPASAVPGRVFLGHGRAGPGLELPPYARTTASWY